MTATRGEEYVDPIALRSPRLVRSFTRYLEWYMSRNFHAARVARDGVPDRLERRALIVYSNHPSWWDPAFFYLLNARLLDGRPSFGPMDAEALRQYGVLRRLGVFGIEPGRRGAAYFLHTSTRILEDPSNALWITAEGQFTDARARPVRLQPGLAHLAARQEGVTILPLAVEYPFWNERKPEALARFGSPMTSDSGVDVVAWNARLAVALAECMDALSELARSRDATQFLTVGKGTTGVGGVYDLWRRARAWSRGERFDPSHEASEQ